MSKNQKNEKRKITKKKTTNSAKYGGRRYMVNKETGETEDVQVISHDSQMDINFHKVWVTHLALALEIVGNVKTKILSYLLKNAKPSNNMIAKTQQEIADECDVSRPSVSRTIKILEEADIITKKIGVIIINPNVLAKGSSSKRLQILHDYRKVEQKEDDKDEK